MNNFLGYSLSFLQQYSIDRIGIPVIIRLQYL